jgi:hypothetical protein
MAVLTGNSASISFKGTAVGKCRSFNLDVAKDALETTVLGDADRTYVEGLRGATGSTTLLYDPTDPASVAFLESIFSTGSATIVLDADSPSGSGGDFSCTAIVTQVSTPVSVGEVTACSVNFQITGAVTGNRF